VQDWPGRLGHWDVGVPPSGPMDAYAHRMANRLVGNAADAAALEITLSGPVLRFNADTVIAVTGAPAPVTLDGAPLPMWQSHRVAAGSVLAIGRAEAGARLCLAVGGGELDRLDHHMHERGAVGIHGGDVEPLQQRQRLKKHRPLSPRPGLVDGPRAIVMAQRALDGRRPARHVLRAQHAPVAAARHVHHLGAFKICAHSLGDEALRPCAPRRLDLRFAPRDRLRSRDDAGVGAGEQRVAKQRVGLGRGAAGGPDFGGGRPFGGEEIAQARDGVGDAGQHRVALVGVEDRRLQRLPHRDGAIVAQHQHPRVERAGDHGGQQAGAGRKLKPLRAVVGDGRACGGRALAADHVDAVGVGGID
ncbi:MAG: hypothetical protein CVT71_02830, partial [Alphaproteobacteria bacterium HGW-Alphaproteobacteria-10]